MANVVNVFSIDEERLRFRVICAIDANTAGYDAQGEYDINIPMNILVVELSVMS